MAKEQPRLDLSVFIPKALLFLIPLGASHILPTLNQENIPPIFSYSSPLITLASLVLAKGIAGSLKSEGELSRGGEALVGCLNKGREAISTLLLPVAGVAANIGLQTYGPVISKLFSN